LTPAQFRFIVTMLRTIKGCIEQSATTGKEVREVVGYKHLDHSQRITLTVVTDPDAGFPAPLQTHGVLPSLEEKVGPPSSAPLVPKRRNQHGRSGKVFG